MRGTATERYVAEVLAVQGVTPSEDAAKAIAPTLTAQLAAPRRPMLRSRSRPSRQAILR